MLKFRKLFKYLRAKWRSRKVKAFSGSATTFATANKNMDILSEESLTRAVDLLSDSVEFKHGENFVCKIFYNLMPEAEKEFKKLFSNTSASDKHCFSVFVGACLPVAVSPFVPVNEIWGTNNYGIPIVRFKFIDGEFKLVSNGTEENK